MPFLILRKDRQSIKKIAALISAGEVIACATETAYGLLAEANNRQAVASLIKMKGREVGKPIALLAADEKMIRRYFKISQAEKRIMRAFWPGPLTLLLRPKHKFPSAIVGPGGLVGVRIPGDRWLRRLVKLVNVPLTATSANRSGGQTPYTATAVKKSLRHKGLKFLVPAGRLPYRPTSTVAKVIKGKIVIVRHGAVSFPKLAAVLS